MTPFLTGLIFAAIGSAHCVGMCGPLVLTVGRTLRRPTPRALLQHSLAYHGGRVLTYAALGVVAGFAGQTLAVWGFGRALAVTAGGAATQPRRTARFFAFERGKNSR